MYIYIYVSQHKLMLSEWPRLRLNATSHHLVTIPLDCKP